MPRSDQLGVAYQIHIGAARDFRCPVHDARGLCGAHPKHLDVLWVGEVVVTDLDIRDHATIIRRKRTRCATPGSDWRHIELSRRLSMKLKHVEPEKVASGGAHLQLHTPLARILGPRIGTARKSSPCRVTDNRI